MAQILYILPGQTLPLVRGRLSVFTRFSIPVDSSHSYSSIPYSSHMSGLLSSLRRGSSAASSSTSISSMANAAGKAPETSKIFTRPPSDCKPKARPEPTEEQAEKVSR